MNEFARDDSISLPAHRKIAKLYKTSGDYTFQRYLNLMEIH